MHLKEKQRLLFFYFVSFLVLLFLVFLLQDFWVKFGLFFKNVVGQIFEAVLYFLCEAAVFMRPLYLFIELFLEVFLEAIVL